MINTRWLFIPLSLLEWCGRHSVLGLSVRASVHEHTKSLLNRYLTSSLLTWISSKMNILEFEVNRSKVKVTSRPRTVKRALCEAFYHLSPECTRSTPHKTDDIFRVIKIFKDEGHRQQYVHSQRRAIFWRFSSSRGLYSVSDTSWDCNLQLPAIFVHASL